eukprot:6474024-Amphidinium_carterae.1
MLSQIRSTQPIDEDYTYPMFYQTFSALRDAYLELAIVILAFHPTTLHLPTWSSSASIYVRIQTPNDIEDAQLTDYLSWAEFHIIKQLIKVATIVLRADDTPGHNGSQPAAKTIRGS